MQPEIKPTTIFRHAYAVYPPMAMLAGIQLDVFTPLKDGPLTATELADALQIRPEKLRLLLCALVHAELLRVEGDRFANTLETDVYLVRGRSTYMGNVHELYSDIWATALKTAQSIRARVPQAKHDFATMSDDKLGAFFRGQHAGALAMGRQLAKMYAFDRLRSLLEVGGGSGGLAIAACQCCPNLSAMIIELPRVAPIARSFVHEANLADRVQVLADDIVERAPDGAVRCGGVAFPNSGAGTKRSTSGVTQRRTGHTLGRRHLRRRARIRGQLTIAPTGRGNEPSHALRG
jgi:2-hydroxy-4-(methylsulfanyl)butanoate S-methyltransferase